MLYVKADSNSFYVTITIVGSLIDLVPVYVVLYLHNYSDSEEK
jgi:hypothetical protein